MWQEKDNTLIEDFEFTDFDSAIKFVNRVAELAQKADHHPDIFLHDYKYVQIVLTTHKEGRVTNLDHDLADKISSLKGKDA
jgi:4a-hydroxytetrahydrobiopterin dehydratase